MTTDEAIRILKEHKITFQHDFGWNTSVLEAIDMAIKALDQEPCEGRMKYVQEIVNTIMNNCKTDSIKDKCFRNAARFIQNAIDGSSPEFELINDVEPCEDAISRAEALNIINIEGKWIFNNDKVYSPVNVGIALTSMKKKIKELSNIQPKPKTNTWSIKEVADALEKHGLIKGMSEISETEIKSMTKEQNYMRGYKDGKSDVLDKIRAEIEQLTITKGGDDYVRKMAELYSLKIKVLQIINKYKAESEDKK